MPGCCVDGCKNRSEKGFRLFRLPTGKNNIERRTEWLQFIGKSLPERAAICEMHFAEDQFESKREDGRKLLRPCAIPNLLKKSTIEDINLTENIKSHNKEKNKTDTNSFSNAPVNDPNNVNSDKCDNNRDVIINIIDNEKNTNINSFNNALINDPNNSNKCNDKDLTINNETNNDTIIYKTKYETLKKDFKLLRTNLKRVKQQCSIYKKKLRQKNINSKIFNADQLKFLINGSQRGFSWSASTINKALSLYVACGQKGYEEIRQQKLPYPSIRTLQHRLL